MYNFHLAGTILFPFEPIFLKVDVGMVEFYWKKREINPKKFFMFSIVNC